MTVVDSETQARRTHAPKSKAVSALIASAFLATSALAQQPVKPPDDASAPLRRFPVSILVRRPDVSSEWVSLLNVPCLRPNDEVELRVDPKSSQQWTFIYANVAAGQKIQVRSWNLWDRRWEKEPIEVGKVPDADVVPLFFFVLNRHHEGRVKDAIQHALETSSEQLVSQTASFETVYQQQNRLLNFMTAYAALGPKVTCDPTYMKERVADINADLGIYYDPNAPLTAPGELQHSLDASVGLLSAMRQSPDNPAPAAQMVQSQLPSVVSDWVSLVGDLMHVFMRPPHNVKLSFTPASAVDVDPSLAPTTCTMQLVTERVLETSDQSLPSLVYRPAFERTPATKPVPIKFDRANVLADNSEFEIPLAAESRDLFTHPWAWDWEMSDDGKTFTPVQKARLVPGRGLVFAMPANWWGSVTQKTLYLRGRVGFQLSDPVEIHVAKVYPQQWSLAGTPDLAVGDGGAVVRLSRAGTDQPYYQFAGVSLTDAAGKAIPADSVSYDNGLVAKFNLASLAPGVAKIRIEQQEATAPDQPVDVFVAPRRPDVSIYCAKGDRILRIGGNDAPWVKTVTAPSIQVQGVDDSDPKNRSLTLSQPLPLTTQSIQVTYREPTKGLEWTRTEPVAMGLPRPKAAASVIGALPDTIPVGSGSDPSWAVATMPPGWIRTNQPVRIQLSAVAPFAWTHDVSLDLGLGSAEDVQKVATIPEGAAFAMDQASPNAYVTLQVDSALPHDSKRTSGLVWLRLTRDDLSSPWMLATVGPDPGGLPIRAIKLPTIQSVDSAPDKTRVTLSNADQVLGVKFAGQSSYVSPQLVSSSPTDLVASVDGPPNATEFDVLLRDASEGVVHVKIVRKP